MGNWHFSFLFMPLCIYINIVFVFLGYFFLPLQNKRKMVGEPNILDYKMLILPETLAYSLNGGYLA